MERMEFDPLDDSKTEALKALWNNVAMHGKLRSLDDVALVALLQNMWADSEIGSPQSAILSESIDRLSRVKAAGWTPIIKGAADTLPPKDTDVIVACLNSEGKPSTYTMHYNSVGWWWEGYSIDEDNTIYAWTPLPDPPPYPEERNNE